MKLGIVHVHGAAPTSSDKTFLVGALMTCHSHGTNLVRERHMQRHKQKDEEAGGEGLGIVCTRKRLWRDADGNIVTKRPKSSLRPDGSTANTEHLSLDEADDQPQLHSHSESPQVYEPPLSPPPSLTSAEARAQDEMSYFIAPKDLQADFDFPPLMDIGADPEAIDFFVDSQWPQQLIEPPSLASGAAAFDDVFNPDTGMAQKTLHIKDSLI